MNENNFMKAEDVARKTSQEKKNSHRTLCLCSPRAHPLLRCAVHARRILSTYAKKLPKGELFSAFDRKYHRIGQRFPARSEHELIALRRARKERNAHRQHEEDEEKQRHHYLVCILYTVCAEIQRQKRSGDDDDVIGNNLKHQIERQMTKICKCMNLINISKNY